MTREDIDKKHEAKQPAAGKDWTGGKNSVFKCIGASNHCADERESNDYYATSPNAIDRLLTVYQIPDVILEPCCGEGHLSERLKSLGRTVYSSDLVDRGYGEVKNFFDVHTMPENCRCILTNPPYKHATEVVLHALDIIPDGGAVIMFLKTSFLEGKIRKRVLYDVVPPKYVIQFSSRIVCAKNGDFEAMAKIGSAVAYCWMIWEKGYDGETTLKWID